MKDFRIRKAVKLCLLILFILCLAACGDATPEVEAIEKPQEKLEDLEVVLLNINYNGEKQNVIVEFETNIPEGTEVNLDLYSPEFDHLTSKSMLLGEERSVEQVEFEISTDLLEKIIAGDYYLKTNVTVDKDNGKNNHMYTEELGGHGDELSERYKDSENVIVELDEDYNNTNFILSIETNKLMLAEGAILDSVELEAEEEIVIESYSSDI